MSTIYRRLKTQLQVFIMRSALISAPSPNLADLGWVWAKRLPPWRGVLGNQIEAKLKTTEQKLHQFVRNNHDTLSRFILLGHTQCHHLATIGCSAVQSVRKAVRHFLRASIQI